MVYTEASTKRAATQYIREDFLASMEHETATALRLLNKDGKIELCLSINVLHVNIHHRVAVRASRTDIIYTISNKGIITQRD